MSSAAPQPANAGVRTVTGRSPPKDSFAYVWRSLFSGGLAGCVAKTAVAPLDRVKILFQGRNRTFLHERGTPGGAFRAVSTIWRSEGPRGLFKGHSAMILRIFPYAAINFMMYEQYKRLLIPQGQPEFPLVRLLCGSLAGATSVMCTYPLDLTRARVAFQMKKVRYTGPFHAMSTMVREEGVRSLYRGFIPTLQGIIPYAGMSFYTYDTLKRMCISQYPEVACSGPGVLYWPFQLAVGAIAGAVAQTSAYPLDVIRRRMQVQGLATLVPKYHGTLHAMKSIVAEEGVRGLYVGLSINYFKVVPATSLSFATYEAMKRLMAIDG